MSPDLYADDETFIRTAQTFGKKFSEIGRKYVAYLLCRSVCAAQRNKPDFSSTSGLLERAFELSAGDVQTLVACATENKLAEWYAKHIQSDVNKNYPPYDMYVDILRVEFPSMPPLRLEGEMREICRFMVCGFFTLFSPSFCSLTFFSRINGNWLVLMFVFA